MRSLGDTLAQKSFRSYSNDSEHSACRTKDLDRLARHSKHRTKQRKNRTKDRKPLLSNNIVARQLGVKPATHCRACNRRLSDYSFDDMCERCLVPAKAQRVHLDFDDPLEAPTESFDPYHSDPSDWEYLSNLILNQGAITPDINYVLDITDNVVWDLEEF